jgi:hypothetical protein
MDRDEEQWLQGRPCHYCGMPADTVDHVVPQSLQSTARLAGHPEWIKEMVRARLQTVACCQQCNSVLGNRIFPTVADRRLAVKRYLRRKYQRLLEAKPWTPVELEQLNGRLREYVEQRQRLRANVLERLAWR